MKKNSFILSIPFVAVTSMVLLAGCAAKLEASNDRMVIVNADPDDSAGALNLAQQECQKRGRQARFNSKPRGRQWVFDCIN
jgi:hypothetical protein